MEEFTRQIYWNVGHGVMRLALTYLLFTAVMVVFVRGFQDGGVLTVPPFIEVSS